jgi:hypothetical protein
MAARDDYCGCAGGSVVVAINQASGTSCVHTWPLPPPRCFLVSISEDQCETASWPQCSLSLSLLDSRCVHTSTDKARSEEDRGRSSCPVVPAFVVAVCGWSAAAADVRGGGRLAILTEFGGRSHHAYGVIRRFLVAWPGNLVERFEFLAPCFILPSPSSRQ